MAIGPIIEEEALPYEIIAARVVIQPLAGLCGALVALGITYVVDYFVRGLFGSVTGAVGWIPWAGKVITWPLHSIEQKLTHQLGKAEQALDHKVGAYYQQLAKLVSWVGHELQAHGGIGLTLATLMTSPLSIPAWKTLYRALVGKLIVHGAQLVHLLRHAVPHMQAQVTRLSKFTHLHVGRIERQIRKVINTDLPSVRGRVRHLEKEVERLSSQEAAIAHKFDPLAFAGLVAVALGSLGGSWIRCTRWRNLGKKGCGPWGKLLDLLLGLGIDALLISDLCLLTKAMVEGAKLAAPILRGIAGGLTELMKCQGVDRAADVGVRWHRPPTGTAWAALPPVT